MRFMIAIATVLATLLVVVQRHGFVEADCCGAPCEGCGKFAHLCNDCTRKTSYCGYGPCNMFGCNCDGGCRKGKGCKNCDCPKPPPPPLMSIGVSSSKPKCQRRQTPSVNSDAELEEQRRQSVAHVEKIMAQADKNEDGRLTLREVQSWAKENLPTQYNQAQYVSNKFSKLDTDQDGFITPQEIDP